SRLSNEAIFGYKKLSEEMNINKVVADIEFENGSFYKLHKEKFDTYENIGSLEGIKNSDLIFVIGSDLANEALGVKWNVMNAVIHNNAKLVTIGAQKYEYDYFTDASLLADYGNYAGIFEDIKTAGDDIPASIREYIDQAEHVTFIVGNEYISSEKQPESIYAFYDYVGSDKVENFFLVSDKANITALVNSGILDNGYTPAKLNKEMVNSKIRAVLAVGFYPSETYGAYKSLNKSIGNVDMLVSVDIYKNKFNSNADIIMPALTSLESESSYTSLDGRLIKTDVVHEHKYSALSDVNILSKMGALFGIELPESAPEFWNENIAGQNGYPQMDFYEIDGFVRKENKSNVNKTTFSYQKPAEGSVEIFVNARYHNNYLSTKAVVEKDVDGYLKKYYFDVDETVLSGKDACYDGQCSINDEIAKGTVLIPKNLR
ncbi:MAG TPA: molybdopterin oxidoreductase, partial [Flexistipes sinusarabici]|nr:molybdopterin oxidoreductase [Flexistipes sinusarabici]